MLDDGINHAKYILNELGFEIIIKER